MFDSRQQSWKAKIQIMKKTRRLLWSLRGLILLLWGALACVSAAAQSHPYAYVPTHKSNTVSVIDTFTNTVVARIPVGVQPLSAAVSPEGTQVYVTNSGWLLPNNDVSVIDTATNTVVATIPVGHFPIGVAFTPNGAFAYVAASGANSVSVIDTAARTVVATVSVGANPFGVAITPNGAFA